MDQVTIPLLHDHHNHPSLYAALSSCRDISAIEPRAILDFLGTLPRDRLSLVRGWRTNVFPLGRDQLAGLPPVLLVNFSLHGFAVSRSGLPFLETAAPELAARRDDPSWLESNVPVLFAAYCDLAGVAGDKLAGYLDALIPLGIGSADDMTVATKSALHLNRKPVRKGRIRSWVAPVLFRSLDPDMAEECAGIKLFLDGAIGSRSAAIAGTWTGGGRSFLVYSDADLTARLEEISGLGKSVSLHAIGELAVEQALRALESPGGRGLRFPLVRLEHAQLITKDQAFRARDLGLTLSMQPNFSSDSRDYADRLPRSYLEANNPFRMLIDEAGFRPGQDLIFGSDGMPNGISYAATQALFPAVAGQRLSLEELVAGYGPSRGISGRVTLRIDKKTGAVAVAGHEIDK